jgi:hypothetical protein
MHRVAQLPISQISAPPAIPGSETTRNLGSTVSGRNLGSLAAPLTTRGGVVGQGDVASNVPTACVLKS